jgi:hypothetical protein
LMQQDALVFADTNELQAHIGMLVELKALALAAKSQGNIIIGLGDGKRVTMLSGVEVQ